MEASLVGVQTGIATWEAVRYYLRIVNTVPPKIIDNVCSLEGGKEKIHKSCTHGNQNLRTAQKPIKRGMDK